MKDYLAALGFGWIMMFVLSTVFLHPNKAFPNNYCEGEFNLAIESIAKNDLEGLKSIIGQKKSCTMKQWSNGIGDADSDTELLNASLRSGHFGKTVCRTEIVSYLISHGAKPGELQKPKGIFSYVTRRGTGNLTSEINSACLDIFNLFLPYMNKDEILSVANRLDVGSLLRAFPLTQEHSDISEIIRKLYTENKKNCPANQPGNPFCLAAHNISKQLDHPEQLEE